MKKHLRYLSYLIRHKWYVLLECFKVGLYWRGVTHDLSKFFPSEYFAYCDRFGAGISTGRDKTGYYSPKSANNPAFYKAWFLHQKRNDHHWQWWTMSEDDGTISVFEMSAKARLEMLCDWRGAGRAQGTPDTKAWYLKNRGKLLLGEETREWIEIQLGVTD